MATGQSQLFSFARWLGKAEEPPEGQVKPLERLSWVILALARSYLDMIQHLEEEQREVSERPEPTSAVPPKGNRGEDKPGKLLAL